MWTLWSPSLFQGSKLHGLALDDRALALTIDDRALALLIKQPAIDDRAKAIALPMFVSALDRWVAEALFCVARGRVASCIVVTIAVRPMIGIPLETLQAIGSHKANVGIILASLAQ